MTFGGGGWDGGGGGGGGRGGRIGGKDGRTMGFMGEYASSGEYGIHGNWGGGDGCYPVSPNYSGSWRLLGSSSSVPHSPSPGGEELLPEKQRVWPSSALQWSQDQQRHGCLAAK